ncbi:MAG: TetR/AcrR family transcriptional regulator [Melioribacteraceae bacterium]|nr:TetR/AcrR family transcriptional regulator [Melioribacteraceae bacterium]MCF8354025.1 TetR/AcrR family transcriptional regulator [Melioribacteraceae bacterium]MCF8392294.1 TetR/AcrR family transcriptional regulator [Melioribacteraceae bacterium]MCF8417626.1 TetR/AcrR family transcriptional regulator [Melioribacteraceae bacterium]
MPRSSEQNKQIREKTKKRILETARTLFAKNGFHGTSISEIAKEAGISKGLTYNYFKSKTEIVEVIFDEFLLDAHNFFEVINNYSDPYEKLTALIESSFDYIEYAEDQWKLNFSLILQPQVMKLARSQMIKFYDEMLNEIEKVFKGVGIKNAASEARVFGAALDGIGMYYMMNKENYPLKKIKKHLLKKYSKEELQKTFR